MDGKVNRYVSPHYRGSTKISLFLANQGEVVCQDWRVDVSLANTYQLVVIVLHLFLEKASIGKASKMFNVSLTLLCYIEAKSLKKQVLVNIKLVKSREGVRLRSLVVL